MGTIVEQWQKRCEASVMDGRENSCKWMEMLGSWFANGYLLQREKSTGFSGEQSIFHNYL